LNYLFKDKLIIIYVLTKAFKQHSLRMESSPTSPSSPSSPSSPLSPTSPTSPTKGMELFQHSSSSVIRRSKFGLTIVLPTISEEDSCMSNNDVIDSTNSFRRIFPKSAENFCKRIAEGYNNSL
jgi:hypothetical protein